MGDYWKNLKQFPKKIINEIFEQCHSAEKCKKGDPLGFFEIHYVAKYLKKLKGRPFFWNPKRFKKSRIVLKKIRVKKRGGILCYRCSGHRCFCCGRGSGVSSVLS